MACRQTPDKRGHAYMKEAVQGIWRRLTNERWPQLQRIGRRPSCPLVNPDPCGDPTSRQITSLHGPDGFGRGMWCKQVSASSCVLCYAQGAVRSMPIPSDPSLLMLTRSASMTLSKHASYPSTTVLSHCLLGFEYHVSAVSIRLRHTLQGRISSTPGKDIGTVAASGTKL